MANQCLVKDEMAPLTDVVVGIADQLGATPTLEQLYDPKSIEHLLRGDYPTEIDMIEEIKGLVSIFEKHKVKVYQPDSIPDCNQIFVRDIAFVIENKMIQSNILPHRIEETKALKKIIDNFPNSEIYIPPKNAHIEGGDVILYDDYIFVGTYSGEDYANYITARTNIYGVDFIKNCFPNKKVKSFDLVKSNTDPYHNALHLDCCFQPVGKGKAIIHKKGFLKEEDVDFIEQLLGKENLFEVTHKEMYQMFCNIFSISPELVISEIGFTRLNQWLRQQGITVEEVKYSEIAKQEGLLRCSTLPLARRYE